jgi:F-type H+-transporting ATPase subunit b
MDHSTVETTAAVEQPQTHEQPQAAHGNGNLLAPDVVMVILTWTTFAILFVILKKFAWKPILDALQKREDYIRQTLDEADKVKANLANAEAEKAKILDDAKTQASQIIQDSRQTAAAVASEIEAQAKKHANDIVSSAKSQIEGERQRVTSILKKEAVDTAIKLAEKVLEHNLDADKNRALIEQAVSKDMNS